jgi:NlpC/P60 family putative phage cell wall peptidase
MTPAAIIAEARTWLEPKTAWRHQASLKGVGADCIGFIAGVAAACGSAEAQRFLSTPAWRRYGREPSPDFMFGICDQLMDRIEITDARPGDVLIFTCGNHPMHFGLIADHGKMIHAWLVARRVAEHELDAQWLARVVRAYRMRGIA